MHVTIALDWTPNTNHTGFYVARNKGWFQEEGLDVQFNSPHVDDYKTTPVHKLISGAATMAVAPSESVISHYTYPKAHSHKLKAIAALLSTSASAVVTLKSSGLDRPAKLDGKTYASYAARYEGRIVQQIIRKDGGKGDYIESTPPMLGIWNTLLSGEADATWVFLGWEGVEASLKGVELNQFRPEDYGVPYGYSPVLLASEELLREHDDEVKKLLHCAARGYQFAASHPQEAAQILLEEVARDTAQCPLPTPLDPKLVVASQEYLAKRAYLNHEGKWGWMEAKCWDAFLDWLSDSGLLTTKVQSRNPQPDVTTSLDGLRTGDVGQAVPRSSVASSALFTNEYLE